MNAEIIGLHHWFETPPGRYLLAWERQRLDAAVADIFGYHGLQLGLPELDALRASRIPHRWCASPTWSDRRLPSAVAVATPDSDGPPAVTSAAEVDDVAAAATPPRTPLALVADAAALPFAEGSLDLVVLPHTLELSVDPHAALREVHRVLIPDGKVVVCGLNPASLWGWRQWRARGLRRLGLGTPAFLPEASGLLGERRLRDWLRLLDFEVESSSFGCWRPAVRSAEWLERTAWVDRLGERWWPIFGAAYVIVATKRVHGMHLLPSWRSAAAPRGASAPVSIANCVDPAGDVGTKHIKKEEADVC